MKINDLAQSWSLSVNLESIGEKLTIQLSLEDSAKLSALVDMYPNRSKESIVAELLSAAFDELEASFPYIKGKRVVAEDELGDPIYEDVGPTPTFLQLSKKHFQAFKKRTLSDGS